MANKTSKKKSAEKKSPYEGKFFYEIVKGYRDQYGKEVIMLYGPLENLYLATNNGNDIYSKGYKYVQVINSKPVCAFKKDEILVMKKAL